jgi:hypothetical protein
VLFTFIERKICERQISQAYGHVVQRCRDMFPFLSHSRILLDIQRHLAAHLTDRAAAQEQWPALRSER